MPEESSPTVSADQANGSAQGKALSSARRVLQVAVSQGLWIAALFAGAGRLDWARGWFCVALYVVGMGGVGLVVRHYNAPLMQARANWQHRDTKTFDKFFLPSFLLLVYIQPAVAGMDAIRFRWSSLPSGLFYLGVVLFAVALAMVTWSMAVNAYAETSVRIQTDRGHKVVTSGPYRIVRHPFYAGAMLLYPGTALVLGSRYALVLGCLMAALFVVRTALEDQTLCRELPGYQEYATRTRYRLLPGVW